MLRLREAATLRGMNFIKGALAWLGIGLVLGVAILLAAKGSWALLAVAGISFVIAVGKIGCSTH